MFPNRDSEWSAVLERAVHNDFMYGALDASRAAGRIDQEYINPRDRKSTPWGDQQWNMKKVASEAAHIPLGMRQDIQAKYPMVHYRVIIVHVGRLPSSHVDLIPNGQSLPSRQEHGPNQGPMHPKVHHYHHVPTGVVPKAIPRHPTPWLPQVGSGPHPAYHLQWSRTHRVS